MNSAREKEDKGLQRRKNEGIIRDKDGWVLCPVCKRRVMKIRPDTTARNLPVYCKRCRRESIVNIEQSLSLRA